MAVPVKQGSVYNNNANLVLAIAVDASVMNEWQGYDHPGYEELTNALFDGNDVVLELAGASGVLFDMGGCGSSNVFRLAADDIVLVEHYSADWNPDIEAQFLAIVSRGIGEGSHRIGTVEITSGALALLHAGDPGEGDVGAPALGAFAKVGCHVLLGVPNGRYAVIGELFEAKGEWGTIETRVRIVREESLEAARAPVDTSVKAPKRTLPEIVRHAGRMPLPDGMGYVASLAVAAKPWTVAGEKSGSTIATWSAATGKLVWSKTLAPKATSHEYAQKVHVSIHGDRIAAAVGEHLVILALDSGEIVAQHALGPGLTPFARMIGASSSFARFAPDGKHVLVGHPPHVHVIDWQSGETRHTIEDCSATCDAYPSPDGSIIALPGAKLHFLDASSFAVTRTIARDAYATAAAFSPRGDVIAIAAGGVVTCFDVATAAARASLPPASTVAEIAVQAIAWSANDLLATASEDGYVRLWNGTNHELVGELPGHDTTIPGTGARSLNGLEFSPDGGVLFVGGAPAGAHALSAYLLAKS